MKISRELSNNEILSELGKRIREQRISQDITQRDLASLSGLSVLTVIRIEKGISVSAECIISVMRALKIIENLDVVIPEETIHPMEIAINGKTQRYRVKKKKAAHNTKWTWGE